MPNTEIALRFRDYGEVLDYHPTVACLYQAFNDLMNKQPTGTMKDLPRGTNYTFRRGDYYIKYFSPVPVYATWFDLEWATWGAAKIMTTPVDQGGTETITVHFIVSNEDWGVFARGWIGKGDIPEEQEQEHVAVAAASSIASLPIQTGSSATS